MADAIAAFTEETDDDESESESQHSHHTPKSLKEEQSSEEEEEESPTPKPLKSILKRRPNESGNNRKRRATKRSISFAPGLVTGKSDVAAIPEDEVRTRSSEGNDYDDSSSSVPIGSSQSLDFTAFQFGGGTMSASETSDDEKDFDKLREKYELWGHRQVANADRKARFEAKKTQTELRLKEQKEKVETLKSELGHIVDEYGPSVGKNEVVEDAYKKWKKTQNQKGVIFLPSIPFGWTHDSLYKIFEEFGKVTNVYLEAAIDKKTGKKRTVHGHHDLYTEGWVEFKDKKIAKKAAELLNNTELPKKYAKKYSAARGWVWKVKYLKGFRWHHLKEYTDTVKTLQQKKYEIKIAEAQRQATYFANQVRKAKEMTKAWGPKDSWWKQPQTPTTYGPSKDGEEEPPRKRQRLEVEQRTTPQFPKYISWKLQRKLKK